MSIFSDALRTDKDLCALVKALQVKDDDDPNPSPTTVATAPSKMQLRPRAVVIGYSDNDGWSDACPVPATAEQFEEHMQSM